jgi:hypothetical protein
MRICAGLPGGSHCGKLIPGDKRRCPEHERAENARRAEKSRRNGLRTPHWLAIRKARLLMDGGLCVLRVDDGCTVYAETVHLALSSTATTCLPRLRTLDQRVATATA